MPARLVARAGGRAVAWPDRSPLPPFLPQPPFLVQDKSQFASETPTDQRPTRSAGQGASGGGAAAGDHHSIQFSTFPAHVAPPALTPSPAPRSHLYYGSNVYRTDRHYGVRTGGGTALAWVRLSVRPLDIPCSMMIRTKSDRPFLPLMIPRSLARRIQGRKWGESR